MVFEICLHKVASMLAQFSHHVIVMSLHNVHLQLPLIDIAPYVTPCHGRLLANLISSCSLCTFQCNHSDMGIKGYWADQHSSQSTVEWRFRIHHYVIQNILNCRLLLINYYNKLQWTISKSLLSSKDWGVILKYTGIDPIGRWAAGMWHSIHEQH